MAVVNNPVVGTSHCDVCGTVASYHETRRGKGKGRLYRRCECGCDQRTGAAIQKEWRQSMIPRPGFEHLAEPKPEPEPVPETTEPELVAEPVAEPNLPEIPAGENREPSKKNNARPSPGQLFTLCFGAGLALLTLGRGGPGV